MHRGSIRCSRLLVVVMVEVCIVIVVGTGGGDGVLGASPSCHIVVSS